MSYTNEYRSKLVSADEAVKTVKNGDWIDYGFSLSNPYALDGALAARRDELKDINVRHCLSMKSHAIWDADPDGEVFNFNASHFGGGDRKRHDLGNAYYIPTRLRIQPLYYRKNLFNDVDVAMLRVTPMDKHGYFNFSCQVSCLRAICDVAKKIIVEVCPELPWACGGHDELVHISEVEYIVEDDSPVLCIPPAPPTESDKRIAEYIMEEIADGACIQLGIGGLPNIVGSLMVESDLKDLGCHTELLVDAFYQLYEAGKLTNKEKRLDKGKSVYSFAFGNQGLYDWIDSNPGLASYPLDYVNDAHNIAVNDNVISINNCLGVDLFGQISSESVGTRHISGTGGQLDFVTGAYRSRGGKAILCCTSTYKDKQGNLQSRIVPTLEPGTVVTVPRTQTHMIVTEFGKCDLAGRTTWERAESIIGLAHPDLRDGLIQEAQKMNIWRKSNKV